MSVTKDRTQKETPATSADVVRLSINLAPDVASILREWASKKRISATESVRRAIAVWNFIETEKSKGNRIAVIEGTGKNERIREVVLID